MKVKKHLFDLPDLFSCSVSIIGLGYVGLPLAVAFSKNKNCNLTNKLLNRQIIGFDINEKRLLELKKGIDATNEITHSDLKNLNQIKFTNNKEDLISSDVFIITVPTPICENKLPDLNSIKRATETVSNIIKLRVSERVKPIIIYESTVYPGTTEEVCIPIIEKISGLKLNKEFYCGYSPERINPGDNKRKLTNIVKVTSGSDISAADWIDKFYGSIIDAGTHKAENIKVAEAAKIIENTQRDINVAFMNELSIIFNLMSIDTLDVLKAAGTKWNFLDFRPGLVGGHCIGVDPYYLKWKAEQLGYKPEVIISARNVNENMHKFIVDKINVHVESNLEDLNILIMGYTFKENCPDIRNTKIKDLIDYLKTFNPNISLYDPIADFSHADKYIQEIVIDKIDSSYKFDVIILTVAHQEFTEIKSIRSHEILNTNGLIFDFKGILPKQTRVIRV